MNAALQPPIPFHGRRFLRYWRFIRPFVGHIMRATVNKIKADAERSGKMRVLIAFGSKRGGTAGLADMIGDALREAGFETVVSPATGIYDLTEFDAVVVVGALYANRWHRDARRFVRRNTAALRELPVWLVSSGPLDESAEHQTLHPPSRSPSWRTELAPEVMSRSVAACRRMQRVSRLSDGQNPRRRLARRSPHPALGGIVGRRARVPGRLLTRKPVTQGRLRRMSIEQSVWRSLFRIFGSMTSATKSGLSGPTMTN